MSDWSGTCSLFLWPSSTSKRRVSAEKPLNFGGLLAWTCSREYEQVWPIVSNTKIDLLADIQGLLGERGRNR